MSYKCEGQVLNTEYWVICYSNILRYFFKNVVTLSVFELGKCSVHKIGIEFRQEENGTIYSEAICQ